MSFLAELQTKQRQMMKGVVVRGAAEMQPRLSAAAKQAAWGIRGALVLEPPGPKGLTRAAKKVEEKYGGDWLQIRDMARCTVVVPQDFLIEEARRCVRAYFSSPSNGFQLVEDRVVTADSNDAGYSGWTINVVSGGIQGEVQINTRILMYAKSLPEFRAAFPGQQTMMSATYPAVAGGLGHILYEVSRDTDRPAAVRSAHARASKIYYSYFRSFPPDYALGSLANSTATALGYGAWTVMETRARR